MARKTHTEAQMRYDKLHRRAYGFRLHNDIDSDIIAKLASVDSMQGYIKDLIREDIKRQSAPVSAPENTISVPLSGSAIEMLTEKSTVSGKSVPNLIALVVNDYLIRTCSVPGKADSVPDFRT